MRWLITAIIVLATGLANAQASMAPAAQQLVEDTAGKIQARMHEEDARLKNDPAYIYRLVDEIILPHFDFKRMSGWVLGRNWRTATPEQQERFTREFRTLLVRTYSKALVDNRDRKIVYEPLRADPKATDVIVRSEVEQEGSFPIEITYSLYLNGEGAWKVYDVNIDGISLVANYRTSFTNEIKQSGLDNLIKKLSERNQQAANE
ncbi:MAG: hypothetical protein A2V90_02110 [Gammaproteobacteria bacterium RBG_16_57_12]|nr:MAG: hypothetical protein A2V90_02110 [Gammaproteobacteria bacterium RBG_16_57_12]